MTRQHRHTRVTARQNTDRAVRPGAAPARAGDEAAVTATSVPPLSGGPGSHGSEATHAFTIAAGSAAICAMTPGDRDGRAVSVKLSRSVWGAGAGRRPAHG